MSRSRVAARTWHGKLQLARGRHTADKHERVHAKYSKGQHLVSYF